MCKETQLSPLKENLKHTTFCFKFHWNVIMISCFALWNYTQRAQHFFESYQDKVVSQENKFEFG